MTKFPCNNLSDRKDAPVPAEIPFTVSVSDIKISPVARVTESDIPESVAVKVTGKDLGVEYTQFQTVWLPCQYPNFFWY